MAPVSAKRLKKQRTPAIVELLPSGIVLRRAWPAERELFKNHPEVAGMASEDDAVVLNPFSRLSSREKRAVALNETARILMRRDQALRPAFPITSEQMRAFKNYGSDLDIRSTIAGRLLSGDPSALSPNSEQIAFVTALAASMDLDWCPI